MFRPGLPATYVDEAAPPDEAPPSEPAPARAKLTPTMAAALADARAAHLTRKVPGFAVTQPEPQPSPAVEPEPVHVIPFAAALTVTPVQPKPAAPTKVTSKPKPGTVPEHIRTGGHAQRTPAGQKH